jgi:hypothetical protein
MSRFGARGQEESSPRVAAAPVIACSELVLSSPVESCRPVVDRA